MFEVLSVAEDERSTAGDLEEVIMRDQALSAKILKVANSAYYGIPRTVETVSRATVLLGFQTVVGLALTVSVYDTLWGAGKGHYLDRRELWKHSLGVATAARLLSPNRNSKEAAVGFTAGMLHDIGKTIFDSHLAEEYGKVIETCQREQVQIYLRAFISTTRPRRRRRSTRARARWLTSPTRSRGSLQSGSPATRPPRCRTRTQCAS
jgi:HD-like signal output (HDOD) protein